MRAKRKKVARAAKLKTKTAVERESNTRTPTVKAEETLGASVSFNRPNAKSGDSFDVSSLLIIAACALGITCFVIATIPATAVPWRPAAIFVSERQLDVTLIGLALLLAAMFTFFWSKGF